MTIDMDKDQLVFTSGKTVYACLGAVGIREYSNGTLDVVEGFDGGINTEELSQGERMELADYMIALWQKFKESGYADDSE